MLDELQILAGANDCVTWTGPNAGVPRELRDLQRLLLLLRMLSLILRGKMAYSRGHHVLRLIVGIVTVR